MVKTLWIYSLGLFSLIAFCQGHTAISCRIKGVFHVELNGRYQISREEAEDVCLSLNSTLATIEQFKVAYDSGLETCRYGFTEYSIMIPRHRPNPICAANFVGIYNLTSNLTNKYDAYCFNSSAETKEKDCDPVLLPNLVIVPSYDPSLQEPTNSEDASVENVTPTDPGKSTYLTLHPTDQEAGDPQGPMDPSTEQPDENTASGDHETQTTHQGMGDGDDKVLPSEDLLPQGTTGHPYFDSGHGHVSHYNRFDNYEDTTETNGKTNKDDDDGSKTLEGPIPKATDSAVEGNYDDVTDEYDGDSKGGSPGKGRGANPSHIASPDASPASDQPKQRRSSRVPEENNVPNGLHELRHGIYQHFENTGSHAYWLIVVVAMVSLGLILSVCIALNSRRICGQKKKLVINGKKGNIEDGTIIEQNGDTAKSQEMVQLVSHDPPEQTISKSQEDLRNIKGVDMKIGI